MRADDIATEQEERHRAAALAYRKPVRKVSGICLNCEEPVAADACYCDEFCREDHEKRERLSNA